MSSRLRIASGTGRGISRPFGRFGRRRSGLGLGWKLTFSYTLVTVGALLVAELALFVGVFLLYASLPPLPRMSADELSSTVAPRLQRPLAGKSPDVETVRGILLDNHDLPPGERPFPAHFREGRLPDEYVAFVLDPEGRMVASVPKVDGFPKPGERMDARGVPGLSPVLEAAREGEEDPRRLYKRVQDGGYSAVAPIKDEEGRLIGAVVETSPTFGVAPPLLWMGTFALVALGLTVVVGILGTVFGFLTARGLTRRLKTLTRASEAWSRGEFALATQDRSGDELGQLSRALGHMTARLDDLMRSRQDLATLEARNRFARDLHDSVKQQVFAASLQVDTARALDGEGTRTDEHLGRANELLRQVHRELDVLIHELRPAMLEGRNLGGALREYAAGWSRGSEIPAEVLVRHERETPQEVEEALFRVAQEALANIARHSGAGKAEVELVYEPDAVVLGVADDGRGFEPAGDHPGFGLRSMRERLAKLGGEVRVESAPGRGTKVVCSCPLAEALQTPAPTARGPKEGHR